MVLSGCDDGCLKLMFATRFIGRLKNTIFQPQQLHDASLSEEIRSLPAVQATASYTVLNIMMILYTHGLRLQVQLHRTVQSSATTLAAERQR